MLYELVRGALLRVFPRSGRTPRARRRCRQRDRSSPSRCVYLIIDRHPDLPGKKSNLKHLGYWHSVSIDPKTNMAFKTEFDFEYYEETFGEGGLPLPSEWVDNTWDAGERAKIVAYLKSAKAVEHWRGYSWCRFGCKGLRLSVSTSESLKFTRVIINRRNVAPTL